MATWFKCALVERTGEKRIFNLGFFVAETKEIAIEKARKHFSSLWRRMQTGTFEIEAHLAAQHEIPGGKKEKTISARARFLAAQTRIADADLDRQ